MSGQGRDRRKDRQTGGRKEKEGRTDGRRAEKMGRGRNAQRRGRRLIFSDREGGRAGVRSFGHPLLPARGDFVDVEMVEEISESSVH